MRIALTLVLAIASTLCSTATRACDQYSVKVAYGPSCPVSGPEPLITRGMSASGDICGSYSSCQNHDSPFLWIGNAAPTGLLLTPAFPAGQALDLNSAGVVVGWMESASGSGTRHGFQHQGGVTQALSEPSWANSSEGLAVNERGIIVGYVANTGSGPLKAALWSDDQLIELDLPVGPNSIAYDVNESSAVCGWMGVSDSALAQGFVWQDGKTTPLPTLPDGYQSDPRAINNHGDVAGIGGKWSDDGLSFQRRAFLWSKGKVIALGVLADDVKSFAMGINDDVTVVGYSEAAEYWIRAFIWQNGVMTDLNDLISPNEDLYLVAAMDINNNGQIACFGVDARGDGVAVRLTPIPGAVADLDCNRVVDVDDLLIVINAWGDTSSPADLNDDGIVSIDDLTIVLDNWS